MIHIIFNLLYNTPIHMIFLYIFICVLLWTTLSFLIKNKKIWKTINLVLGALYLISVLYITIFSRTTSYREVSWTPFHSLYLATEYPDIYNEIAMNIIMFTPLGLVFPYIFDRTCGVSVLLSVAICCAISVIIELCQFVFMLGRCELDDVIANTLGAFLGCVSYIISGAIEKFQKQRKIK